VSLDPEYLLRVANYAIRRHKLYDFDPWDFVSMLWLRYETTRSFTYLRLSCLSFAYAERRKRSRVESSRLETVESRTEIEGSTVCIDDLQENRWRIARMLATGMSGNQVAEAVQRKHNTVSQTRHLMRGDLSERTTA